MADISAARAVKRPPRGDNQLLGFSKTVVTKGEAAAGLGNPGTIFSDLANANEGFEDAILAMTTQKDAGPAKASARNLVLRRLAAIIAFVNDVASQLPPDEGKALIASVGLTLRQMGVFHKQQLTAKYGGISGAVLLMALAAAKQAGYVFAYSMDQKTWVPCVQVFKAKMVISGLTVGTTYYFRFQAQTRKGFQDWSTVVSFVVR